MNNTTEEASSQHKEILDDLDEVNYRVKNLEKLLEDHNSDIRNIRTIIRDEVSQISIDNLMSRLTVNYIYNRLNIVMLAGAISIIFWIMNSYCESCDVVNFAQDIWKYKFN